MVKSDQKTANFTICVVLFAIAVALRATGADYGFFNGDERVNDSARFLAGELVPTQHFYPPFYNYLIGVTFVGLFVFGLLTDMWATTNDFRQVYFADPTPFYLTARYVTAAIGAISAPLCHSCARRCGLPTKSAFAVGIFAAVLPLGVFMAHTAKGDTGMAVGCLAVVWAFLARIDTVNPRRWDIALGITVAIAFSFKQSAVLVLGPASIAMLFVLARREGWSTSLQSFGRALLVVVLLWPVMNIGILLDLDGFLAFQRVQAVMSIREQDGFGVGLPITLGLLGDIANGLNPIGCAIAAVAPVWFLGPSCRLRLKDALIGIWCATLVSTILISLMVGTRQPEQLFLPNVTLFLLLSSVAIMDMLRVYVGVPKAVIGVAALASFALMVTASGTVLKQALAKPVAEDLAAYLAQEFPDARIQTGLVLPVPQTVASQQMELARFDRLARKYGITMPGIAPERVLVEDADIALFWVNAPFVMYGLEADELRDADFPVQPHGWPVQPEEWQLQTWRDMGFDVIVVNNIDFLLTESRSSNIRAFHAELLNRCVIAREFDARKPLFLEYDVTVFDCSDA